MIETRDPDNPSDLESEMKLQSVEYQAGGA